jgi:hypothetical protein
LESGSVERELFRMNGMKDEDKLCAYCGAPALTGTEEPEHIFPAAINGRLTTRTVCVPCNRSAGRDIDQRWLSDPFVLDLRFSARIPDRRGKLLDASPMLTGMTDDGRRLTMRPDGTPVQLNTPVSFDEETGEYTISAADQEALDEQLDKQRRKAERKGKSFTPGHQRLASDQPEVHVAGETSPGVWYREAAKIALALLAEQQPAAWRQGRSAQLLRAAMKSRPTANEVRFISLDAVKEFAGAPASAAVLSKSQYGPAIVVSLMGTFGVGFQLVDDLDRIDWAWVSDPLHPDRNANGPLGEVIYARHRALGLLD